MRAASPTPPMGEEASLSRRQRDWPGQSLEKLGCPKTRAHLAPGSGRMTSPLVLPCAPDRIETRPEGAFAGTPFGRHPRHSQKPPNPGGAPTRHHRAPSASVSGSHGDIRSVFSGGRRPWLLLPAPAGRRGEPTAGKVFDEQPRCSPTRGHQKSCGEFVVFRTTQPRPPPHHIGRCSNLIRHGSFPRSWGSSDPPGGPMAAGPGELRGELPCR